MVGPAIQILPTSALIIAARFRRQMMLREFSVPSISDSLDFKHLLYPWKSNLVNREKIANSSRLRSRVLTLNFYLHRTGLAPSPICHMCRENFFFIFVHDLLP